MQPLKKCIPLTFIIIICVVINSCSTSKKSKPSYPIVLPSLPVIASDRDNDGVLDEKDKCPSIPGLALYEGCPIPDTDGDGINDEEDKCPNVPGKTEYNGCPSLDTNVTMPIDPYPTIKVDSTSIPIEYIRPNIKKEKNNVYPNKKDAVPNAAIAISFKPKMKIGVPMIIRMVIQLNKVDTVLEADLRKIVAKQEDIAILTSKTDESKFLSLNVKGCKSYIAIATCKDAGFFKIVPMSDTQQVVYMRDSVFWYWEVYAQKQGEANIWIELSYRDEKDSIHKVENGACPLRVLVTADTVHTRLTVPPAIVDKTFINPTLVWAGAGFVALLLAAFLLWKRKKRPDTRVFFSYARGIKGDLINRLFSSLRKDGFSVVRDKENLHYKGIISAFMKEIGKANLVVVAISDKYLTSKYCMYELYQVYNNSNKDKDVFLQKIFPIRIEEDLDLNQQATVNHYIQFWENNREEENEGVKKNNDSVTTKQINHVQFVRQLVVDLPDILLLMADINASTLQELTVTDFAELKSSLREGINEIKEKS